MAFVSQQAQLDNFKYKVQGLLFSCDGEKDSFKGFKRRKRGIILSK